MMCRALLVLSIICLCVPGYSWAQAPLQPAKEWVPFPDPDRRLSSTSDPERRTPVVIAVEKVAPAVVSITTEMPAQDPFDIFYGKRTTSSDGSGVVIDAKRGILLTNAHVVERASRIQASFADSRSYEAQIVGIASELDLAVLRLLEFSDLKAAPIGKSGDLMLGEPVIAIGNPFGLGHTVTTGVVSAINRPLETDNRVYQDFIQTDASINPGNSGGPLLNVKGELVGINTAIRPDAEGIGFAIPADRAIKVAQDLLNFGSVQIPWLGIDLRDVVFRKGRSVISAPQVVTVHAGSLAAKSTLRKGDLLLKIDGREINSRADLNAYLSSFKPGKEVRLDVEGSSGGRILKLRTAAISKAAVTNSLSKVLGIEIKASRVGVQVTRIRRSGSFYRKRLRKGDRIVALNGTPIKSLRHFHNMLSQAKSEHRSEALFTIRRGGAQGRIEMVF